MGSPVQVAVGKALSRTLLATPSPRLPPEQAVTVITTGCPRVGVVGSVPNTISGPYLRGRASYLGERSAGHQDPGATSSWLLVKTVADTWAGD